MKYILFLFVLANIVLADTKSNYNYLWIHNQIEEPTIENNFQEKKYFHTTNPSEAVGVFILNGIIHHDKITNSLKNKDKQKKLLYNFEEHDKFK